MRRVLVIGDGLDAEMLALINRELTERNMNMDVTVMSMSEAEAAASEVLTSDRDSAESVLEHDKGPLVIGSGSLHNYYPTLLVEAMGGFEVPDLWLTNLPVTRQERRQMWHHGQHHEARRQQSLMARARRR